MEQKAEVYDFLILLDATASMESYIKALNNSLPKIISVSALTDCFARIGILAYRDYSGGAVIEWSGWYGEGEPTSREHLIDFAKRLRPEYGGDWPEAAKSGFAKAYSLMRAEAKTLILLYTDAPPHMIWNTHENRFKEQKALGREEWGKEDSLFKDWVSATSLLQNGKKKAQVFAIVQTSLIDTLSPFLYMCHRTLGTCLEISLPQADLISSLSMHLLLTWMGAQKQVAATKEWAPTVANWLHYRRTDGIENLKDEKDKKADVFFLQKDTQEATATASGNIERTAIKEAELAPAVTGRPPVQDFAKRYAADEAYRVTAVKHLRSIIREDVSAIALNPVFGTLWRAVCNDRTSDFRDELIAEFGSSIEKIKLSHEKEKMKKWLEESYNYGAEIAATIEEVKPEDRYPCVFLDPTQDWSAPPDQDGNGDVLENRPINAFTRDELLEIGRSCDYKILRRLGRVLTRLTYVSSADKLPAHVKDMSEEELPRIPLALAKQEYKRTFWKILLHIVVPGTKLGPRPAALLAALSIKMGMKPLRPAADREMLGWKSKWNTLDIPETWNTNCLSLILHADADFQARQREAAAAKETTEEGVGAGDATSFLSDNDRGLFKRLVAYSMLKANLETQLTAKVGWNPDAAKVPMGPLVICKSCEYPRSVTIMAPNGVCGICACPEEEFLSAHASRNKAESIKVNVKRTDTESSQATWVECFITTCRAQYIVYDTDAFNVRPKCHYCRQEGAVGKEKATPAPCVECTNCLSRIIWPTEYRPDGLDLTTYKCPGCQDQRKTIITIETTVNKLRVENGTDWMIRNQDKKIPDPFSNQSLFKTISAAGVDDFVARVDILPNTYAGELKWHGKLIRNSDDVKTELRKWIEKRRVQAGACSLCFSDIKKRELRPACGRSGCKQLICTDCQKSWYGLNAAGRIINVAALSCPFCRRQPTPKAAGNVAYLGNLCNAVSEAGSWIYAWCEGCGQAKEYMERVCAQGPPPEESHWKCEGCKPKGPGLAVKHCPVCDVATQKMSGCDHISCQCGAHWCFYCGAKSSNEKIYQHMSEAHGGWWDGDNDPAEEEYWTEEEYGYE